MCFISGRIIWEDWIITERSNLFCNYNVTSVRGNLLGLKKNSVKKKRKNSVKTLHYQAPELFSESTPDLDWMEYYKKLQSNT